MRVIFDLTLATRKPEITGVERYGINLFEAFRKICPGSTAYVMSTSFFSSDDNLVLCQHPLMAWLTLPFRLASSSYDAAVFPSMPASPLSISSRLPLYRIIHDDFPWTRGQEMPIKGRLLFRDVERAVSSRYRAIFAPTGYSAAKLRPIFPSHDVSEIGNAPALPFNGELSEIAELRGKDFVLSVGTVEPRKNYEKIIDVAAALQPHNVLSVVVGRSGWGNIATDLDRASNDPTSNIRWMKDISDSQLRWLYANCRSFLSLSHDEGFNMPLVEAGSLGCSIVASDIAIHRTVSPPWGRLVSPGTPADEIATEIMTAPRATESAYLAYRARYSWDFIAANLLSKIQAQRRTGARSHA
ncbi:MULTISPECIES: glycosyltransferase [Rhizobium/Agrobacterium group]|uniref:glycosyltransferase n=1 Tax=Rhizobium/Agrobacterium group TaxID=227290 RepID=UPI0015724A60|nr:MULTISPECIES: glycosyltransferase [Rhizobium/Agrobacterium group]MBD8652627.1 glycosyltransferase [Rhizobium sp. CFBP 13726]NSY16146.1 glycosyltransferase family 4 protein [Neorhizobium sp. AL 9.2.2]